MVLLWAVVVLCLIQGAYMAFDGARALVLGSYATPSSGAHAGQLGPWSRVVSAAGIPPESTAMKTVFVVLGALWLLVGTGIAVQAGWTWPFGLVLAVGTLWYLVSGTVVSVLVLGLLFTPAVREALDHA